MTELVDDVRGEWVRDGSGEKGKSACFQVSARGGRDSRQEAAADVEEGIEVSRGAAAELRFGRGRVGKVEAGVFLPWRLEVLFRYRGRCVWVRETSTGAERAVALWLKW